MLKSLDKFFEAKLNNTELNFGKEFTYNPSIHVFNEVDQKLMDFLMDIYMATKPNNSYIHYSYGPSFNKKEIELKESQFVKVLDILKNRDFACDVFGKKYNSMIIKEENLPLNFDISKVKDGVSITLKDCVPVPIAKLASIFHYDGIIYFVPPKQAAIYLNFLKFMNNNTMNVLEKDYAHLGTYIIPALKEISSNLTMNPNVNKILQTTPLVPKLYFDKIDKDVQCSVVFSYGNLDINPLSTRVNSETKEDGILVRDMSSEGEVIHTLSQFKFKPNGNFYYLDGLNQDDILNFISFGIQKLQDNCELYYSDSFKNIKIYNTSKISSSVKINDEDLIEFSFDIDGLNKKELLDVYSSLKLKKKYHKLKDGGFVLLDSPEFQDFMHTINYLGIGSKELSKDIVTLPKYNSLYLDDKLKSTENFKVQKNKKFRETIANIKDMNESEFTPPQHLDKTLREYQKTGFKWFSTLSHCGFGGILADEMGLGKTLQSISYMCLLKERGENLPMLVVCPTSLVYNWESEIYKFAPELKSLIVSGNKELREKAIEAINDYDVIITSYPLMRIDIDLYKNLKFCCTFLDEAQNIKNANSVSAKSVKSINTKYRFALTGTPIENNLSELWSIFDFIMPGYLLSQSNFKKLYETPIVKSKDENALVELNRHVNPFILRRYKKDVIKELPPKIEHKFLIDLSEEQKKVYASYVKTYKEELDQEISANGLGKSKIKILSLLTRLRQICCDPSSFIEDYKGDSAKIDALMEIVQDSLSENHRILIFSQFTTILQNIRSKFSELDLDSFYLDGSTPSEKRIEMVNEFNEGKSNIFLISLKAGGTGLNLTGADTVIHFDPWWNPAVEEQATDRAHRIGQKKTVEVIKLITKGTIEEKISILQEKKKDIFNSVVNNVSNENVLTSMDEEEIMKLFT